MGPVLGRMRAHDGPGQRSPGPAHPPPGWNAGTLELSLRGTQTTDKLSYVLVGSNRQTKSPVGLQKGNTVPEMGSESFSMSDSRFTSMLRVAQGAPSRRERSNCGADEWTHSSNLACRPRMSTVKNAQRPEQACARRPKEIVRQRPLRWES